MKFSLFLNTRNRPHLLRNFLNSVYQTTSDKNSIEIIITYDDDDELTHAISKNNFGLDIRFIRGPRPDNLIASYNRMVRVAKGENLFVCNDDISILTKSWDEIALNKINEYKEIHGFSDNIYYCKTHCNSADRDITAGYCSFPIISKKATEVLGFFMYESFKTLGGDTSIYRLYKEIERIIDLQEIKIDHILHNTVSAVCSPDKVAEEYRHKFFSNVINPLTFDVSKEAKLLIDYINENSESKFFE
jgi:hypothetical protein